MEMLRIPGEYIFRLQVEHDGETVYDLGVAVDPHVLRLAREEALESVLRLIGRRLSADWKDREI